MDSSKIIKGLFFVVAAIVALYLGVSAATAQFETLAWVGGTLVFATCLLLGRRIWLLIPFLGALNLTIMIPGRPTSMQTAQILVVGFCLLLFAVRRLNYRFRFTELEFWMALLLLAVVQVYLRNPTGVGLFGGDTVGGRPYIIFGITWVAAMLLAGLRVDPKELKLAMKLSILGGFLNFATGVAGRLFPNYAFLFGVPSGVNTGNDTRTPVDTGRAGRISFLAFFPITLANWVSASVNPIRACFSVRWLPLVLLSIAFATLSGYRNVIGAVGLTYLVGIFYRGGLQGLMVSLVMGVIALAGLSIGNMAFPLPANVQRALSFLPGAWDKRYVWDAESSTDWRVEVWKEVLFTDRWISNKVIGDGLGFTSRELEAQKNVMERQMGYRGGVSGFDAHRETILANGDYHSGPVSAVRTIGYVGLAILALAQLRLIVHAHRQIQRARGTEWFTVTLFFCIPIIWAPIFFWLIFGGFAKDAPLLLMNAAMLRMLQNNLPLPAWSPVMKRAALPAAANPRLRAAGPAAPRMGPAAPNRG